MGAERVIAIIPARLASTRFPEKVLAADTGKPLVQHVYEATKRSRGLDRVVVACDHERVERAVRGFGGECVMTRVDHPNGTSRLHEAAGKLGLADDDIVVNVQGDEPELEAGLIEAAVETLRGATISRVVIATIASPFAPDQDPANPAIVKVVRRRDGTALYFSRSLIPYDRDQRGDPAAAPLKHVGLYAYRRRFLADYVTLLPSPLEQSEQLEQLRALEHGYEIGVAVREVRSHGIDTPEQYRAFVARFHSR
jgi:3-deoxy-manno-octulosonate cytidylyltransferase (CMP-KDO synthetase)